MLRSRPSHFRPSPSTSSSSPPPSQLCLLHQLPSELLEDVLSMYVDSSFLLSVCTSLCSSFRSLLMSDAFCHRLLVLLYSSLSHPQTPLSSFTDLTQWEDFPSYYSLFRALFRYSHLLGHWRSSGCYLGQLLCFELDVRARQIYGMEVGPDGAGNRAVVEVDLLEEEEPQCYFLEYRSTSPLSSTTCIRHPAIVQLQWGEKPPQRGLDDGKGRKGADGGRSVFDLSSSIFRSSFNSLFSSTNSHHPPPSSSQFTPEVVVDAFTPPPPLSGISSSAAPFSSFSLYCPSLGNSAYLALGVQNLPTPLQRRQQALFYPNPPSSFYRLPPPASLNFRPPAPYPPPGLYVGQYGPHGPELMEIDYLHSEMVATKVTGDANVPAGKISFRVQLPVGVTKDREEEEGAMRATVGVGKAKRRKEGKRRRCKGPLSPPSMEDVKEQLEGRSEGHRSSASKRRLPQPSTTEVGRSSTVSPGFCTRNSHLLTSSSSTSPLLLDPPSPISTPLSVSDEEPTEHSEGSHEEADEEEEEEEEEREGEVRSTSSVSSDVDVTSSLVDDDGDIGMQDNSDSLVRGVFLHFRRHLPSTPPPLPSIVAHPGLGTIALTGFNSPQAVEVTCHFHSGGRFTLDFLGLIGFVPFHCPCQEHKGEDEDEETVGMVGRESRRGSGERRKGSSRPHHMR